MKSRFTSLALAFALACSLAAPAFAADTDRSGWLLPAVKAYDGQFTDAAGRWYEQSASVCYETGLMSGLGQGTFDGTGGLACEQLVTLCARLLEQLSGKNMPPPVPDPSLPWYQHYYDYLAGELGTSAGELPARCPAKTAATRAVFAELLAQTLDAAGTSLPAVNEIAALPDSDSAAVLALYNAGILTGLDGLGTFGGEQPLTRAEAAAMLARVVDPGLRQRFTLFSNEAAPSYDLCRDVLQLEPDTVLLTVGTREFTAEVVAAQLVREVLTSQPATLNEVPFTLKDYFAKRAAVYRLAEVLNLNLTGRELRSCANQGAEKEGQNGLTAAAWTEQARYDLIFQRLQLFYFTFYSDPLEPGQTNDQVANDISLAMGPMRVVTSKAFDALDYAAIRERALASPLKDVYAS